jgi:hypothetical protein
LSAARAYRSQSIPCGQGLALIDTATGVADKSGAERSLGGAKLMEIESKHDYTRAMAGIMAMDHFF